jgi:hypothetical protein
VYAIRVERKYRPEWSRSWLSLRKFPFTESSLQSQTLQMGFGESAFRSLRTRVVARRSLIKLASQDAGLAVRGPKPKFCISKRREAGRPSYVTVKLLALDAVPAGVVITIFPVFAPVGTVAVTCVSEFTVKLIAATPPKVTFEV